MKESKKTTRTFFIVSCLAFCFSFSSSLFAQEVLPKPGEVIDKSNYKQYANLFPEEFLQGFEDGWGGIYPPISCRVKETVNYSMPKIYLKFSEKNRGKYSIGEDGLIKGGFDHLGLPFPGLTRDDPDFGVKLMWNFAYRYAYDDYTEAVGTYMKRKGEPVFYAQHNPHHWLNFVNRMFDDPKPVYKTPENLWVAQYMEYDQPDILKNQGILSWRYLDPTKPDDTFVYLPSLRRVLRGEAGQRSTPIAGAMVAQDDFLVFDGRTQDFTYTVIGEQKVLGISDNEVNRKRIADLSEVVEPPWATENWEVKDVYVIDIVSKDPKYPQKIKRIYMDKGNPQCLYWCVTWDRAGKPWKLWASFYKEFTLANGELTYWIGGQAGIDLQASITGFIHWPRQHMNGNGLTYRDVTPTALLMIGR